jgi:catechol 2,3-dioxygenase-like lactoylglutathione lyase family enzyme
MFREPQVNVYVDDVEASVTFYTQVLGFTETFRTPEHGAPDHVEVRMGGLILGFASLEAARRDHDLEVGGDSLRFEIVLWTDDVDRAYERLIAHGAKPMREPHEFLGRIRAAWVTDLNGNPIEIAQEVAVASDAVTVE